MKTGEAPPAARCPAFGRCGGCSLQNEPYGKQLADKEALLARLLREAAGAIPPLEAVPSPPFEYRSRVELHRLPEEPPARRVKKLRPASGETPARAGFMARGGAEIVPVRDCPVAVPAIRAALRGGLLAPPPSLDRWAVFAADGMLLEEGGRRRGLVHLLDKTFTVDAGVFFQSNLAALEALAGRLGALAERYGGAGEAWDLYGGAGTFAVFLLPYFSRLRLLEADKTACALARENLERNHPALAARAPVYALDDRAWAGGLAKRRAPPPAFVCADPPREGLSPEAARFLASCGARAVAYVSCDPRSLARDTRVLLAGGYKLAALRLYDFYPQTPHIESLAVFELPREGGA